MNANLILLVIFVPLIGSGLSYVAGRSRLFSAGLIASVAALASFGFVLKLFDALNQMADPEAAIVFESLPWFELGKLQVSWTFVFDRLSALMCLLVTGVGSLIHLYACGYMSKDPGQPRFFAYMNLFLASMLVLVLGSSLPVMFIGWEGVGLCSYLLIGFWFSKPENNKAAQKAFVMNRIGDLGLLLGMFLIADKFATLEFAQINEQIVSGLFSAELLTIIGILLLFGAIGKSAQLPLFTWLPDAMAGPTPVSALIHAATMVTAGVYLLARLNPLFMASPVLQYTIAVIAVVTAFMAATTALVQNDIKKILAYSTISQLGFMFAGLASGAYWLAIFHVLTHGFFKACLFLGAGSVIHACDHEQDIRKMGGLRTKMPLTFIAFSAAALAIAGIAPFAGYYSKHLILEAFSEYSLSEKSTFWLSPVMLGPLLEITSLLTAFYIGRCWVLTFFGKYRGQQGHSPHEVPFIMSVPVLILAALSVGAGMLMQNSLPFYLQGFNPADPAISESAFSPGSLLSDLLHSALPAGVFLLSVILYRNFGSLTEKLDSGLAPVRKILYNSYFLDQIYSCLIIRPLSLIGWFFWKAGDELFINGVERSAVLLTRLGSEIGTGFQSGQLRHYALYTIFGLAGLFTLLIYGF